MNQIISCDKLNLKYGRVHALNDLSTQFSLGKIVGLLGYNGSGKSSLLKVLAGLNMRYTGELRIDNTPPGPHSKSLISYLPDSPYLMSSKTAGYYLKLYAKLYADFDEAEALRLVKFFQLDSETKISQFSKGQFECFMVMLALSRRASIYLLDEPLSGVDVATKHKITTELFSQVREHALLIVASHLIHDLEFYFDELCWIHEGKLILHDDVEKIRSRYACSLEELLKDPKRCPEFLAQMG